MRNLRTSDNRALTADEIQRIHAIDVEVSHFLATARINRNVADFITGNSVQITESFSAVFKESLKPFGALETTAQLRQAIGFSRKEIRARLISDFSMPDGDMLDAMLRLYRRFVENFEKSLGQEGSQSIAGKGRPR